MNNYIILERLLGGEFAFIFEFEAKDSYEAGTLSDAYLRKENKTGLFDLYDKKDLNFGNTKLDKPFRSVDVEFYGKYGCITSDIPEGFWLKTI
jgi:hypothetical protein